MLHIRTYFFKCINRNINSHGALSNNKHCTINLSTMQERKKTKKFMLYFNAKLKVLGSGAAGAPSCIYLLTDNSNYMFNCGESTQRLGQEHQCKLSKVQNIFITYSSWKNLGGIPGSLLTAQADGVTQINIHGPEVFDDYIKAIKPFVHLSNLKITYPLIDESKPYEDHVMRVSYVPITKVLKDTKESSSDLVDKEYHINANHKRVIDEETDKQNINTEKKMKSTPHLICYICEVHPRRGKLIIDKCINYGVPPGPLLDMLKHGRDITKPDGTVVRSKDVVQPDTPKTTFIVLECPTEEYLDSILNHPTFLKYQQTESTKGEYEVFCIFHFTPENIFTTQRYQDWLKKFSSNTEHIVLNNENTCMGSEAVYKNQYLLNMLHPEIFPLLNKDRFEKDKETQSNNIHRARTAQTLEVRPVPNCLLNAEIYKEPKTYIDEVSQIPDFTNVLKELKTVISKKSAELNLDTISDYPRIVMLGTGCSVPNKVRNTSSILLRINKDCSILLDCGEGTLTQIVRFFGASESLNILRTIKAVYISHIHADHHLGLMGVLLKRKEVTDEMLYLMAPKCMTPWLNYYNGQFESVVQQYILVHNDDLYLNSHKLSEYFEITLYNKLNINEINTIYVTHCKEAYGIAITLQDNKKIVYSGDTIFCQNLIKLGQNCDLLIHEATMESGLEALAKSKLHSTTSEAIRVGKFMSAKFILLTHFSQRYSKIPFIPDNEANVGIAYDNMEFRLPQLSLLPLFYPCIKVMFNEYNKVLNE
ncbi:ribonuclease Z, mitochondrial isoform X1 [Bombus affinis]|uniref:ribonuclease Z, mitochondrial isoform X1 n=2 Tax=Bombus affinis TaxID=309941 RepID=UPI0021B7CB5D|nr:ribonuclease Z, mitochondrial isoform X1 [Bombus affinis]XP_050598345.1 ribonuclease Z, mitochondrial isoform X1 [Bombus affinis]